MKAVLFEVSLVHHKTFSVIDFYSWVVLSGADGWPAESRPARGRLRGAGDRRNDGGIDGRRRLTGQSPTATAGPIDKGCTADMRTPARHGAGARGALLPRGVRGRVDREVKRTGGCLGAQRRSRGSTGPARKGAERHVRFPPRAFAQARGFKPSVQCENGARSAEHPAQKRNCDGGGARSIRRPSREGGLGPVLLRRSDEAERRHPLRAQGDGRLQAIDSSPVAGAGPELVLVGGEIRLDGVERQGTVPLAFRVAGRGLDLKRGGAGAEPTEAVGVAAAAQPPSASDLAAAAAASAAAACGSAAAAARAACRRGAIGSIGLVAWRRTWPRVESR